MDLPPAVQALFRDEIYRYEEERTMPFMTSFERLARTEELLAGIEVGLELKFGSAGLQFLEELRTIQDVEVLRAVLRALRTTTTLGELRRLWAP